MKNISSLKLKICWNFNFLKEASLTNVRFPHYAQLWLSVAYRPSNHLVPPRPPGLPQPKLASWLPWMAKGTSTFEISKDRRLGRPQASKWGPWVSCLFKIGHKEYENKTGNWGTWPRLVGEWVELETFLKTSQWGGSEKRRKGRNGVEGNSEDGRAEMKQLREALRRARAGSLALGFSYRYHFNWWWVSLCTSFEGLANVHL